MKFKIFSICQIFLFAMISFAFRDSFAGSSGREIYESKCVRCHGSDGTRGRFGAKNLRKSSLSDQELKIIVSDGKRFMPSWKRVFKEDELLAVIDFVKTLRK